MGLRPQVSIIIPCKNEGENITNTLLSMTTAHNLTQYEIIVVDDASSDNCCAGLQDRFHLELIWAPGLGAAQARNTGANKARGDLLVFCDGHLVVEDFWLDKLVEAMQTNRLDVISPAIAPTDNPDNVGYGQSLNEDLGVVWYTEKPPEISPIAIAPGACLAVKRGLFQRAQGFETGFQVWGYEDIEFSIKLWLLGYQVWIHPEVKVLHVFRKHHPYPVLMEHVNYNLLRMGLLHLKQDRVNKIVTKLLNQPGAERVITQCFFSDAMAKRVTYRQMRTRNDDWFFKKFAIPF